MLYMFKRYKTIINLKIDIDYKIKKIISNSRRCIIVQSSTFFRKLFFRSLLLYLNIINCNFFFSPDNNYFYFVTFMYAKYSIYHPSFYSKNLSVL